jgi:hypothetical protein
MSLCRIGETILHESVIIEIEKLGLLRLCRFASIAWVKFISHDFCVIYSLPLCLEKSKSKMSFLSVQLKL